MDSLSTVTLTLIRHPSGLSCHMMLQKVSRVRCLSTMCLQHSPCNGQIRAIDEEWVLMLHVRF